MTWKSRSPIAQAGDLVQMVGPRQKIFFIRLSDGEEMHTNYGVIPHQKLIGKPWGTQVFSHAGHRFLLLPPRLEDLLLKTHRTTQILFPKDIGFILLNLNITNGDHVLEAGTGSGALTTALAHAVGETGCVTTYEIRPEMQALARENLSRLNLEDRVNFKLRDIRDGFDEVGVEAVFLDIPHTETFLPQVGKALSPGGCFGCILPTANQVSAMITGLENHNFDCIEVCEILVRYYKPVPQRLRPKDRMVAHTGYLLFARAILPLDPNEPA